MALPGLQIRNKNRLRKEPYKPLAPSFQNRLQQERAVKRRTEGLIRPKLKPINQQLREEGQAHQGRVKDLSSYYDYYGQKVQDAYAKAQDALNQVLATSSASTEGAQNNLLAALERTHASDQAQANAVGGVLPAGIGDDVAVEAAGAGQNSLANLAQIQSGAAQEAAGRISGAGLARTNALEHEQGRFGAIQQQLRKKRGETLAETGAAREEARKDIENEELARATERNRETIARKSLKLEGRKTGNEEKEIAEKQRSDEAQEGIAWAQIHATKNKYRNAVAEATTEAEKEAAEAKSDQYNRGVEIFQGYFDKTKPKSYNPQTLFRNLTLAVPANVALEIMSHGPPKFQQFVASKRNPPHNKYKRRPGGSSSAQEHVHR